jgi:ribosomal protein S18 acetylase RimI-like enzyme/predicted GNAT family acetyltransferase
MTELNLTVQPAFELPLATLAEIITDAFTGYVGGEVNFTTQVFAGFMAQSEISLGRSLVAMSGDQPAGIALIARRGSSSRVALMGIVQQFQEQKVGIWLMQQVIDQAKERGDQTLVLEVIEQNPRAVRLYESFGFSKVRRLIGYSAATPTGTATDLIPIDISEAARRITAWGNPDLPWQCTGEAVIKAGPPGVAYKFADETGYAVLSSPQAERIVIQGLAVPLEQQRKGQATRLVAALIATHPGKNWYVSPICPEEFELIFTRNGFMRVEINQFQMELEL